MVTRPIFIRLREVHGIFGEGTCEHEYRCSCTDTPTSTSSGIGVGGRDSGSAGAGNGGGGVFDDGMSNAWFPGASGSVSIRDFHDGLTSVDGSGKRVLVSIENGRRGSAVYRSWEGKKKRSSSGSGAPVGAAASTQGQDVDEGEEEEKEWEGYPHPPHRCPTCMEREGLRAHLRREETEQEREERERMFADVGLGLELGWSTPRADSVETSEFGSPDGSELDLEDVEEEDDVDEEEEDRDSDESEEEWDAKKETQPVVDVDGHVYPPSPPAHDKRKLAMGKCDGIREILLFGDVRLCFLPFFFSFRRV